MKNKLLVAALWFPMSLLIMATVSNAQTTPPATPTATPISVELMYTGKLLGYFRVPSLQRYEDFKGCYQVSGSDSRAAREFLAKRGGHNSILVGTGDNFSPQLEARIFSNPPNPGTKYAVGNKELYFGNDVGWIFYDQLNDSQRSRIAEGRGTIPTDNVGCFLRAANFTAIVPGKHDFYFGAERVRQFARLLAEPRAGESRPVQMLGANLVIKTVPIESEPVSDKIPDDAPFTSWPENLAVQNLQDKKTVYPWFSYVKIKLVELQNNGQFLSDLNQRFSNTGTADFDAFVDYVEKYPAPDTADATRELTQLHSNAVQSKSIRVCRSSGGPNEINGTCDPLEKPVIRWTETTLTLSLQLPEKYKGKDNHFSTLEYAQNYGLCVDMPQDKQFPTKSISGCMRFAVHTPFFYFPHRVPNENNSNDSYTDPDPYVVNGKVAIFGVVDPNLSGQVGILNFAWLNKQPSLTTPLSAEDPAEALRQLLDYFERRNPGGFDGIKVLLAQTTPQRARALAAKFPEFQIVVSAADLEQGTSESTMSTVWKPGARSSSFLAVPTPYVDTPTREGTVHFGMVNASRFPDVGEWKLTAANLTQIEVPDYRDPAADFWKRIRSLPRCLPRNYEIPADETIATQTLLKWAVLCSMRDHVGADIALIQSRDLYDKIPDLKKSLSPLLDRGKLLQTAAGDPGNIQQTLDRLIWKGDLVTLLYVPGADLRKALKQSAAYRAEEMSTFALAVEKGRQLETLGVREENGEYFVRNLPLDDKKIYAVATTDYIGAGDTGYPDLVKAALNPRTHPRAYLGDLVPISSIVCRNLLDDPDKYCLGPLNGKKYLDESSAAQIPPYKSKSWFSRAWEATGFKWPGRTGDAKSTAGIIEQKVQRRGFWAFSLQNFSLGFKDLNNNRTDANIKENFAGVSTSGVNAKESRTINVALDSRFSYFAHKREFFIGGGIDFESQSTGSTGKRQTENTLSQIRNKLFGDIGVVFWRRPGRAVPNLGAVFSVHGETQLQQPFYTFTLSTPDGDPKRIDQGRGLLLLGRLGMRWQNKANSLEVGGQFGREMKALTGYRFEDQGVEFECLVSSSQTLTKCIEDNSKPPGPITIDSKATALQQGRPRMGIYWNHAFSIPFSAKLKYEVTQDADFFFVNFHRDTSIDTRFRYQSKNRLSFMVWKNFSIGPTLDLLLYQNKVNRSFLFQRQVGIETKLNFDIFNRREKGAQIKQEP